jgi:replication-associated recombination protein RarA
MNQNKCGDYVPDLAITMRPKSFEDMIGSEKLIKQIKDQIEGDKAKKAWLFSGGTGSGKTTIARIMALAWQCKHVEFGSYCRGCYKARKVFDITEIYASKHTGKDAIEELLSGYVYEPKPGSKMKVYILNEVHRLSTNAQDSMLGFTEDVPRKTRFILTTTEPDKVLRALRRRCEVCKIQPLGLDEIRKLVKKGLTICKSEKSSTDLSEKLMEKNVTSAGLIVNAIQKYAGTASDAEEASNVELGSGIDTLALCTCIVKGDWDDVSRYLLKTEKEDMAVIRASVQGYLRTILLGDKEFGKRTDVVAKAILELHQVRDEVPAVSAVLYKLCKQFAEYKR